MRNRVKLFLDKHLYLGVIVCSLVYYQLFAKSPTPDIWEKLAMGFVIAIIVPIYLMTKVASREFFRKVNFRVTNMFIISLMFPVIMAISQYFILLLVFEKNPPISVGIPYIMYSFTQQRFLFTGLFYNFIFYLATIVCLNYIRDKA